MPEVNPTAGTALVLKAKDLIGLVGSKYEGKFYDGICVLAEADGRLFKMDTSRELITLTQYNENTLILKAPTWNYDLFYQAEEIEAMEYRGKIEEELVAAINNAQDGMPEARKYVNLKMEFKSPIKLSGEVLHKGFDDGLVFPIGGKVAFKSGRSFFYWKVARVDTESFKKSRAATQTNKSKGASLFDSPDKQEEEDEGMLE